MERLNKYFSKLREGLTQPQGLRLIALLQALLLIILVAYVASFDGRRVGKTLAEIEASIDQNVIACNHLQPTDRPACAEKVGIKIAALFESPEDRIKQCMKLRPLLVRYCQQGLLFAPPSPSPSPEATASPSATPAETATASPTPTPEPTAVPTGTPAPESPTPTP